MMKSGDLISGIEHGILQHRLVDLPKRCPQCGQLNYEYSVHIAAFSSCVPTCCNGSLNSRTTLGPLGSSQPGFPFLLSRCNYQWGTQAIRYSWVKPRYSRAARTSCPQTLKIVMESGVFIHGISNPGFCGSQLVLLPLCHRCCPIRMYFVHTFGRGIHICSSLVNLHSSGLFKVSRPDTWAHIRVPHMQSWENKRTIGRPKDKSLIIHSFIH